MLGTSLIQHQQEFSNQYQIDPIFTLYTELGIGRGWRNLAPLNQNLLQNKRESEPTQNREREKKTNYSLSCSKKVKQFLARERMILSVIFGWKWLNTK